MTVSPKRNLAGRSLSEQSWQRRLLILMSAASLVIASGCQDQADEPVVSGPASTEAAISATTAPASITTSDDVEVSATSTVGATASTTIPVTSTTTRVEPQEAAEAEESDEVEEAAEPEIDASDAVNESAEPEAGESNEVDESDESEDPDADESEAVNEQPTEPPPLCHEMEFDPDDTAELLSADYSYNPPLTASDNSRVVVATVFPRPNYASAAAHDRDGYYRTRMEAYEPQSLVVTITDSSGLTIQHQLALNPPEPLPHPLHYAVIPEALIIGPQGWMFAASGIVYMNVRELVPGRFDEYGPPILYPDSSYFSGPDHDEDGFYFWLSVGSGSASAYCFVSLEDLGITYDDWFRHGTRSMDGYLGVDEYRGLIWYSEWDGTPIRSDLPESSGECCELFALSEGYAIVTNEIPHGYGPRAYWPPTLFFSSDGIQWQEVAIPTSELPNAEGQSIWVCHFEESDTGIRVIEGRSLYFDSLGPCDETREWATDPDFTSWRLQEPES